MLFFIVTPLITSAIFYASNGKNHIAYIDSLFMVVSAMTVTGLNSVLLADLTLWQQIILFVRPPPVGKPQNADQNALGVDHDDDGQHDERLAHHDHDPSVRARLRASHQSPAPLSSLPSASSDNSSAASSNTWSPQVVRLLTTWRAREGRGFRASSLRCVADAHAVPAFSTAEARHRVNEVSAEEVRI